MSKPLVTYARVENVLVDFLEPLLAGEATVGAVLPAAWTPASDPHVSVTVDGTPIDDHPVSISPTVRLVAWSPSPTDSHDLVMLARAHVLAHVGDEFDAVPLTGPQPATDEEHGNAALCAVTCRVRVRSADVSSS